MPHNELAQLKQQLSALQLRQQLVAQLLNAKSTNPAVAAYHQILHHDFLEFANQEDFLEDKAQVFIELQEIGKELQTIGAYPEFYKKRSVAVAGGFSAGKSEFISNLFKDHSIKLPSAVEPTTAIPTYVLDNQTDKNSVLACNHNGGTVDLLAIDPDFQNKLSHQFISSFGFNLKTIMPFMFLSTPLQYKNLCFIDTPGYNPSDTDNGYTSQDIQTAAEFAHNAEALIWLIGLDVNGTIPKSDLDFLEEVAQNNKPLYIVLNKADLRPEDQLEDIMAEVLDTLDDYGIEIQGMSAFSSIMNEEYLYEQQSLRDFLDEMDVPSDKHRHLIQRIYEIDQKYQYAILRNLKQSMLASSALKSLELDLLQQSLDDLSASFYQRINRLKSIFAIQQPQKQLNQLAMIIEQMVDAIDDVFGSISNIPRQILAMESVEIGIKYQRLMEKDELDLDLDDDEGKAIQHHNNYENKSSKSKSKANHIDMYYDVVQCVQAAWGKPYAYVEAELAKRDITEEWIANFQGGYAKMIQAMMEKLKKPENIKNISFLFSGASKVTLPLQEIEENLWLHFDEKFKES